MPNSAGKQKQKKVEVELEPLKESVKPEKECKDFDDILDIVGSSGKYQKFLLYGVICPITTLEPFFTLNAIFLLFEPDHFCHVPGRDNFTSLDAWKNLTLPKVVGQDGQLRYSQCSMYDNFMQEVPCESWEYDRTDYDSTIPTDFNWVCSQSSYATDSFTVYAIGNAIGTILFGQAADMYGRKPIFFLTCFINIFFRIVSLFIPKYFSGFLITQFLVGTTFPAMFIAPSMIVAEMCDKDYRAWIYAVTWQIWVLGMAALPLVAYLCREWFIIGLLTSVPGFLLFLYIRMMPESPRWLVSQGKTSEAAEIIVDMANKNGTGDKLTRPQLDSMLNQLVSKQEKQKNPIGFWTLFTRTRLAKNTMLLTLSWSMNVLVYYGITLNTTHMAGNQFINFFILSIIELPSGYFGGVLADKMGRRWIQVAFFFACGLTCFAAAGGVTDPDLYYFNTLAVILAKFSITLTFLIVYLQGAELFPTQLRSTGSGFASTVASAMGIMGPTLVSLGKFHLGLPYVAMGSLSFIGMVASAFLPETLNQNLPETIEDANAFGKNQKFWSLRPHEGSEDESLDSKLDRNLNTS